LLDVIQSALIQVLIAVILFGLLLVVAGFLQRTIYGSPLSIRKQIGLVVIALVFSLPILGQVLQRFLDIYDVMQTILLAAAVYFLYAPVRRLLTRRGILTNSFEPQAAVPQAVKVSTQYRQFVDALKGDWQTADRLITLERRKDPRAGWQMWVERAHARLIRDQS
jgi:hypothetical protein